VFWVWLRKSLLYASELPENRDRLRTIKGLWKARRETV